MKKIFLSFTAVFLFANAAFADIVYSDFKDVPSDYKYVKSISWMEDNGVVQGFDDSTFRPERAVNRVEFLKMLYETVGMEGYNVDIDFTDVPENAWYTKYVKEAFATNVVNGYDDGTFRPANTINTVEALKIVSEALYNVEGLIAGDYTPCFSEENRLYSDEDADMWYAKYLFAADTTCTVPEEMIFDRELNLFYFNPAKDLTRGEMAEILYRAKTVVDNGLTQYDENYAPDDVLPLAGEADENGEDMGDDEAADEAVDDPVDDLSGYFEWYVNKMNFFVPADFSAGEENGDLNDWFVFTSPDYQEGALVDMDIMNVDSGAKLAVRLNPSFEMQNIEDLQDHVNIVTAGPSAYETKEVSLGGGEGVYQVFYSDSSSSVMKTLDILYGGRWYEVLYHYVEGDSENAEVFEVFMRNLRFGEPSVLEDDTADDTL